MEVQQDMDLWILKNENMSTHFHPEIELDFVVSGCLSVMVKDTASLLNRDDCILMNPGVSHSLHCQTDDTIFCRVLFSCRSIAAVSGKENTLFYCNSTAEDHPKYHELQKIFHALIYDHVQKPRNTSCLKKSNLYKLLDCLLEYFQIDPKAIGADYVDDLRMMQIVQYVDQNFTLKISLSDLAEQLYMSKSTLSRFFKKQTGIYFTDYVNQIRLKYATDDLLYSSKTITKIAVDNGFSNVSSFNKVFRENYGLTPTQFRAQETNKKQAKLSAAAQISKEISSRPDELDEELKAELREKFSSEEELIQDHMEVHASLTKGSPFPKIWGQCINIGSAYSLTEANLQHHILYLRDQMGFTYGRIWSIFSQKLTITDGKAKRSYNYDKIDIVLDFLISSHITPFLDFGNRPNTAIFAPNQPIFYEEDYIPFASKELWQDLLQDFILHITNRYGEKETSKWIFEFSFSSSQARNRKYYKDENFDYNEAFQFAYRVIKKYLPTAKVGGPMGELSFDYEFVSNFIKNCQMQNCMPDFISFMLFPYVTDKGLPKRASSPHIEQEQVKQMRRILRENNAQDCALYITEWNQTLSNRNYLNDSCYRAAYIAKKATEFADQIDLLVIWTASDWVSSYYDTVKIANGGSGLLTKDHIRKPAYFALQFLQMMGTVLIDKGSNYLITKGENRDFYILCFNYKWFGINYFVQEENLDDPEKLDNIFEDDHSLDIDFSLSPVEANTEYIIKKRSINDRDGSILAEWKNFQYDPNLKNSDISYIREICFPRMSMERRKSEKEQLSLHISLLPHEVALLHIYKS